MNFIDLFAGIGGFRIALEKNAANCVYSSELDAYAQDTYQYNFKERPDGDITKIQPSNIPNHDILCAGFPCQAFSISGKQRGFDDSRGTLFFNIASIVKSKKPKIIFLENVKNLLRHDNGKTFSTIKKILEELDYRVFSKIINSSHYGVPQSRQRIYLVCFHNKFNINDFTFPNPTYKEIFLKDIMEKNFVPSVYNINRDDIKIFDNSIIKDDLFDKKKFLRPLRVGTISKGGQGERIYSIEGHAITLSANGGGIAGKTGAYIINNNIRQLTERECLRAQGFPEDFLFPESVTRSQAYKMCGNSVSVPVIDLIFQKIKEYL